MATLAAAAVSLLAAGSAAAGGRDGRIAFSCAPLSSEDQEICVVNADGSGRRALTRNRAWDGLSSWSPNGRLIAFASDRADGPGGDTFIYVMAAHGGPAYRVSDTPGFAPDWSPNGWRIVFVTATEPALRLRIVDLRGERELTTAPYSAISPSWSSRNAIAFTGGDLATDVFAIPASGGSPTNLTEAFAGNDRDPDWSPDGRALVFASDRATPFEEEIFSMKADGSRARRLTDSPGLDVEPAWSPGGRHIVFTSGRDAGEAGVGTELYVMNADGSRPRRITFDGGFNGAPDWKPTR